MGARGARVGAAVECDSPDELQGLASPLCGRGLLRTVSGWLRASRRWEGFLPPSFCSSLSSFPYRSATYLAPRARAEDLLVKVPDSWCLLSPSSSSSSLLPRIFFVFVRELSLALLPSSVALVPRCFVHPSSLLVLIFAWNVPLSSSLLGVSRCFLLFCVRLPRPLPSSLLFPLPLPLLFPSPLCCRK